MDGNKFIDMVKRTVAAYVNETNRIYKGPGTGTTQDDIAIVWAVKVLQNNKALACVTNTPENTYYELTYNGDTQELYIDRYVKDENICVKVK